MLILTRYRDQKIIIGNLVELTVNGTNNKNAVSIGLSAPKYVPIHREEIYLKTKEDDSKKVLFSEMQGKAPSDDSAAGNLILTRYKNQAIMICDDVKVIILNSHKGCVRIGIDAPKEISVHREEIQLKISRGE